MEAGSLRKHYKVAHINHKYERYEIAMAYEDLFGPTRPIKKKLFNKEICTKCGVSKKTGSQLQ